MNATAAAVTSEASDYSLTTFFPLWPADMLSDTTLIAWSYYEHLQPLELSMAITFLYETYQIQVCFS